MCEHVCVLDRWRGLDATRAAGATAVGFGSRRACHACPANNAPLPSPQHPPCARQSCQSTQLHAIAPPDSRRPPAYLSSPHSAQSTQLHAIAPPDSRSRWSCDSLPSPLLSVESEESDETGGDGGASCIPAGGWGESSPSCAWIGSPCLRDCAHGASITRRASCVPGGSVQLVGAGAVACRLRSCCCVCSKLASRATCTAGISAAVLRRRGGQTAGNQRAISGHGALTNLLGLLLPRRQQCVLPGGSQGRALRYDAPRAAFASEPPWQGAGGRRRRRVVGPVNASTVVWSTTRTGELAAPPAAAPTAVTTTRTAATLPRADPRHLQARNPISKVIEARWGSKSLALAGQLRPRRLNNWPFGPTQSLPRTKRLWLCPISPSDSGGACPGWHTVRCGGERPRERRRVTTGGCHVRTGGGLPG
jgi:hypothetical protein